MAAALQWAGDEEAPVPASFPSPQHRVRGRRTPACPDELPPDIQAAIWRGTELGSPVSSVLSSGFAALDRELPGAGWPCHSLTEILQPQPTVAEWRLLAPAIRRVVASGLQVVIVGPPKTPHLPGLRFAGLDERHMVWIQAETPSERLWVTEQLVKANAAGLLVSWLPQARQEQIRRLHGRRGVRYSLMELAFWAADRGERLRWLYVPLSVACPRLRCSAAPRACACRPTSPRWSAGSERGGRGLANGLRNASGGSAAG